LFGLLSISVLAVIKVFDLLLIVAEEIVGSLDEFDSFADDLDFGILGLSHNLEVVLGLGVGALECLEMEAFFPK
jgi:hypothetical protein